MMRITRNRFVGLAALLTLAALLLAGLDPQRALEHLERSVAGRSGMPVQPAAAPPGETITIATFNIQVFGVTKASRPHVMEVLTDVVRRFDLVAIQELRSLDQSVVPDWVEQINADGSHYGYVVGPRLGRTHSKEQYVYLYDMRRIELIPGSVYTVADPDDLIHRPPLVARFRVRGPPPEEAFSFTLVNIHTDPDETAIELDALADVFVRVQHDGSGEDDMILLGDLNVGPERFGRLGELPGIAWVIPGHVTTNTRRTRNYDNLVFDARATGEYTGEAGVLCLESEYGLTREQALEVSDHLPVWARFSAWELRPRMAGHAGAAAR